jgi:hypothetical protein
MSRAPDETPKQGPALHVFCTTKIWRTYLRANGFPFKDEGRTLTHACNSRGLGEVGQIAISTT